MMGIMMDARLMRAKLVGVTPRTPCRSYLLILSFLSPCLFILIFVAMSLLIFKGEQWASDRASAEFNPPHSLGHTVGMST
jgi:hypothetical protein